MPLNHHHHAIIDHKKTHAQSITMWELFTGGHAFGDVPRALLGHKVAVQGERPAFPSFAPREYVDLAESCWQADPDAR